MDIKFEPLAIITLTESETKSINSYIVDTEFDCNLLKQLIQNTMVSDEAKTIIKQIYATVMSEDAWYCKLIKADVGVEELSNPIAKPVPKAIVKAKQKILFLNTVGGSEVNNPIAVLVEVPGSVTLDAIEKLEALQVGSARWIKIMQDGDIPYIELKRGRKNVFKPEEYDAVYYLKQVRPQND